jgi:hypothetical protein
MDCIDCHTRPSHIYHPPSLTVDHVMAAGMIDTALPYAKSTAVKVLDQSYSTSDVARDSIRTAIEEYYKLNYPNIASVKQQEINGMIETAQKIYARNNFPRMRTNWRHFPNNVGHLFYPGCFRCHDNKHVREDGKVLTNDCNICHTILSQQYEKKDLRVSLDGLAYQHPVDIGNSWKEMRCSDCHTAQ